MLDILTVYSYILVYFYLLIYWYNLWDLPDLEVIYLLMNWSNTRENK